MPNKSLQPTAKTIEEVLTGPSFYKIPRFQRPYSWEADHIDDFWVDAVENLDSGYFIGPMVVYREDSRDFGIVDGQQRLTTITLILGAIRDNFDALGAEDLAEATHRFIERKDNDGKYRFVLQSDVDEGEWIQKAQLRRPDDVVRSDDLDANAWAAFRVVTDRLGVLVANAMGSATGSRGKTRAIKKLKALRDQVLGLEVIWVPLNSVDDAYEIFETLNSRGKDLEVSDRLKNFFLGHLRASNANVDDFRRRWNVVSERFADEPASRDLNRFILHWWLSQRPYVAERKMFKEVKRNVRRGEVKAEFVRFEKDSSLYRTVVAPETVAWTIERLKLRDSLTALQIMRLAQPMPFVLSLMRCWDEKKLSLKQIVAILSVIENYHFQVTAISTRSSSGGVSEMYAKHARQLALADSATSRREALGELASKLRARRPTREEFSEAFVGRLVFAEEYSRDKKLVQYVLAKLHRHSRPTPTPDFSTFTIEHIAPQKLITSKSDLAIYGSIGNLLYIDESLNQKLDDKQFDAKKRLLKPHRRSYDLEDVLEAPDWTEVEIRDRGIRLSEIAYAETWGF